MKRVEAVLPDSKVRQVLVLLAEDATELHVTTVEGPDEMPAMEPLPVKDAAPQRKTREVRKMKSKSDGPIAREVIPGLIRANPLKRINTKELRAAGPPRGFNPDTLGIAARKMVRAGELRMIESGVYALPEPKPVLGEGERHVHTPLQG